MGPDKGNHNFLEIWIQQVHLGTVVWIWHSDCLQGKEKLSYTRRGQKATLTFVEFPSIPLDPWGKKPSRVERDGKELLFKMRERFCNINAQQRSGVYIKALVEGSGHVNHTRNMEKDNKAVTWATKPSWNTLRRSILTNINNTMDYTTIQKSSLTWKRCSFKS